MQHYNDILAEVLIDEKTLKSRIRELGAEISVDYPDGNLLLICILRGGVPFLVEHLLGHRMRRSRTGRQLGCCFD